MVTISVDDLAAIMNAENGQSSNSVTGKSAETAGDDFSRTRPASDKIRTKSWQSGCAASYKVLNSHLVPQSESQFIEHASVSLQDCKTP